VQLQQQDGISDADALNEYDPVILQSPQSVM